MYIKKSFTFLEVLRFSGGHLVWIGTWTIFITVIHEMFHPVWMAIPWLPVSVIGTALAFYLGFKNNQAYDRLWEARKIWGAIVNSSRALGTTSKAYIGKQFTKEKLTEEEINEYIKKIFYRHIAWLYALRSQLLLPTPWEHVSQQGHVGRITKKRIQKFGTGLLADEITINELNQFLPQDEFERLIEYKNTATQIIDQQSQDLKKLREKNLIDDFRHMELQNILNLFYDHQGKAERIKKFPLPRQYGNMSQIFIGIFIFLLPFAMVSEFHKLGELGAWISVPFTIIIAWVYLMMELVGDYSENPFEGLGNDIPMYSLCRVIEIDLREMLGETDLPPNVEAKDGILM